MQRITDVIYCAGCGVEFTWAPVVSDDSYYCCRDCLDGCVCSCGERMEMDDDRRMGYSEEKSVTFS